MDNDRLAGDGGTFTSTERNLGSGHTLGGKTREDTAKHCHVGNDKRNSRGDFTISAGRNTDSARLRFHVYRIRCERDSDTISAYKFRPEFFLSDDDGFLTNQAIVCGCHMVLLLIENGYHFPWFLV